ncbi:MAG: insulinase family protein, partial [Gammaproteobacteria bacterium]|nr:insulinase family protein [Gammaproteobacteria bacterium]
MNMKTIVALLAVCTLILGGAIYHKETPVPDQSDEAIKSYRLSNGMKVLVIENHRAPVMVSQVWYKVGASYEHDGITGISHVLEHMMFKGTEEHPAGEFSEIIAANGGEENAFTGQDFTAYFQKIANDRLELCLELEADRMRNITFDEKEFIKELEVVKEERRLRTEDKPPALTYERFNAAAFTNSPYRRPIIGWMEDLDTMTVDDARKWYETWYAPNNATLVVAGDVDAEEVYRLAKQYFGKLPTSEIPELKPR